MRGHGAVLCGKNLQKTTGKLTFSHGVPRVFSLVHTRASAPISGTRGGEPTLLLADGFAVVLGALSEIDGCGVFFLDRYMDGSPWLVSQTWEIFIYAMGVRPLGLVPTQ